MTDWTQAKCLHADPEVMFPDKGESPWPGKRVCVGCPIVTACLEEALDNAEAWGVWGGLTRRERAAIAEMGGWPKPSTESPYRAVKCGTNHGYQRHVRRGETACGPCRRAHADEKWEQKQRREAA